jgi:hypothetical protein
MWKEISMIRRLLLVGAYACVGVCQLAAVSCDPEKASLELFRRQGLNLVKPLRDYIKVGGIVVRRGGGPMEYIDPPDAIAGSAGGGTAFVGVLMGEAKQNTTKFGLAMGIIKTLLPGSLDVSFDSTQEVKLDQVNALGKRLTDAEMKSLIQRNKTKAEILDDLNQGLSVFAIQEVYSASEMQISSSNNVALNVKYANGSSVQDCTPSKDSAPKADKDTTSKPSDGDKTGSSTGTPAAKPASPTPSATKPKTAAAPDAKPSTAAAPPAAADAAANDEKLSIGFGMCRAGTYSLKFKTEKAGQALPFAVRLKEVERRDGVLALKRGTVVPNATLGPNAQRFALIDEQTPVIAQLVKRPKK